MTRDLPPLKSAKNRRQTFPPSNPAGGGFHACDYGSRFMDCCAFESRVKACDTSILKPASFLKKEYADIPGALCPRGSLWYKCPGTTPLFVGCCRTNPCLQNGCPSKDLMAATLVSSSQKAWPYISTLNPRFAQYTRSLPVPSALLPTRSLSSPNLPTTTGTTQPSGSESPNYQTRIKVDTIGGAIGGVVGGVLVGIFIGTIFLVHRYRKASKRPSSASISSDFPDLTVNIVSPTPPLEAEGRPFLGQNAGSPISELYPSPIPELLSSPISELLSSPISELLASPISELPS